jgi:hypothetical protein
MKTKISRINNLMRKMKMRILMNNMIMKNNNFKIENLNQSNFNKLLMKLERMMMTIIERRKMDLKKVKEIQ